MRIYIALFAIAAVLIFAAFAKAQNVGQCPCHKGGAQCYCNPASICPNCPQHAKAPSTAYRAAGYDSRLVQAQPGVRITLACAPVLRVDVVQQPPVLQFRIQQPRQYVIEAPVFIEPPVVRFTAPVYYAPPSQTVIRQRTFTPPVYQLPTFSRTVIRCRT